MNRLLQKDFRLLVDVRKKSVSMKFGFSKCQLQDMCEKLDIRFVHMPELGVASEKRKDVVRKQEYTKLLEEYAEKTLSDRKESVDCLYNLWNQYDRIASRMDCLLHRLPVFVTILLFLERKTGH